MFSIKSGRYPRYPSSEISELPMNYPGTYKLYGPYSYQNKERTFFSYSDMNMASREAKESHVEHISGINNVIIDREFGRMYQRFLIENTIFRPQYSSILPFKSK